MDRTPEEMFDFCMNNPHSDGEDYTLAESICQSVMGGYKFGTAHWKIFEDGVKLAYAMGKRDANVLLDESEAKDGNS